LRDLLLSRYGRGIEPKLSLVRNGVSQALIETTGAVAAIEAAPGNRLQIAYFGTIAEWLNFDVLLAALDNNPHVEFHLVGPISIANVPRHERLKFHKPMRHDELARFAAYFDGFVMPFRLNPLTEAVDPVKLYEYLAFGKEVIAVRYKEIERFSPFVHFYRSLPEFLELIDRLALRTIERKNTATERSAFLAQSTWHARCNQVCQLLAGLDRTITV